MLSPPFKCHKGASSVQACIMCSHAFFVLSPFPGRSFESFRLTECDLDLCVTVPAVTTAVERGEGTESETGRSAGTL